MSSRFAMKVSRLLPTDGTGDCPVASSASLPLRNRVWMLIMFWQNFAGLSAALFPGETSGWPTMDRYRSVFVALKALLTSTIGSFSGTSATGAAWLLAADSSSRACDVPGAPPRDRSGAAKGLQPSTGSRKSSSSALSLPLEMTDACGMAAAFVLLNCAVRPVAVSRYCVVTLSLWSWSTRVKARVVGQAWPVFGETPAEGTVSLRCLSARRAAQKKCVPWQNDTWPKGDPRRPSTQWPWIRARGVPPTCVRVPPLKPKSIVTTAPLGSLGTTGATAGRVPFVITSGSYTDSFPVAGSRIVACTKAPRLAAFAMVQPEAAGDAPSGP